MCALDLKNGAIAHVNLLIVHFFTNITNGSADHLDNYYERRQRDSERNIAKNIYKNMRIFMLAWVLWQYVAANEFPTSETICAVLYDDFENNPNLFFNILHEEKIPNLRPKIDDIRWTNIISDVQVTGGCTLFGYNKPDYESLLGTWEGDYKMGAREDNKISSIRCECQPTTTTTTTTTTTMHTTTVSTTTVPLTCRAQYYGNDDLNACSTPTCNVAQFTFIDSWKSQVRKQLRAGLSGTCSSPTTLSFF